MGLWPGGEPGIPDSDGSWKPRELPEEEGDSVGSRPRKRVTTRGWKRVCQRSSPSETTPPGNSDFSPSSPQWHALLLLLAAAASFRQVIWLIFAMWTNEHVRNH